MAFEFSSFEFSEDREPGKISIQDFFLFFKLKTEKDFEIAESFRDYQEAIKKNHAIIASFRSFKMKHENYDESRFVPDFLWQKSQKLKNKVWMECLEILKEQVGIENFERICRFFQSFRSDVINKLSRIIKIKDGEAEIDFLFSENFRFKAAPDSLNVFNLQKDNRDVLIPQNENSSIFAPDFRQFEFRTFLNIQGIDSYFEHEQIYEKIGKDLNIPNPKEGIISYLYGSKNQKFESFFNKEQIFDRIENQIFWFGDCPVFVKNDYEPGKKIHTIIQTISQFFYVEKLGKILDFLEHKKSCLLYPHHDCLVFSLDSREPEVIDFLLDELDGPVYKTKWYIGTNYRDVTETQ